MIASTLSADELPLALLLPLAVDVEALVGDAAALPESAWIPHFNTRIYEGDWSGVPFRAPNGDPTRLYPDLTGRSPFADTPWLLACKGVAAFAASLPCTLSALRFLRLGPGSRIHEHRDYDLGYRHGEVRLHIPITTDADVDFIVDGTRLVMNPGEVWYADFERPHRVENRGALPRIHLVVDCVVDPFVEGAFVRALETSQSAS